MSHGFGVKCANCRMEIVHDDGCPERGCPGGHGYTYVEPNQFSGQVHVCIEGDPSVQNARITEVDTDLRIEQDEPVVRGAERMVTVRLVLDSTEFAERPNGRGSYSRETTVVLDTHTFRVVLANRSDQAVDVSGPDWEWDPDGMRDDE